MTHRRRSALRARTLACLALGLFPRVASAQDPAPVPPPDAPPVAAPERAPAPPPETPATGGPGAAPQESPPAPQGNPAPAPSPAPQEPAPSPAPQEPAPQEPAPSPAPAPEVAPAPPAGTAPNTAPVEPAAAPAAYAIPTDLASVAGALAKIAAEHATLARAVEFATLTDGRKLPALVFGAEGPAALETRPTVLLLGALDGETPTGGLAVLQVCAELLREPAGLSAGVAFVAVPWASPEALELFLQGRSADGRNTLAVDEDRDGRVDEDGGDDLDGDGAILQMLVVDPEGPWTRTPTQRLLSRAGPNDAPRYRLTPEGKDDDKDGRYNEDGAGGVVLDLNFPVGRTGPWADNLAGVLPLSEALPRTYADYALAHRAAIVLIFQGSHGRLAIPGGSKATTAPGWMPDADRGVFERVQTAFLAATSRKPGPLSTVLECRGLERRGAAVDWFYSAGGALALELAPWGPALDAPPEKSAEDARYETPRGDAPKPAPGGALPGDEAWLRWIDDTTGGIGFKVWSPVTLDDGEQVLVGGWVPGARTLPAPKHLPRMLQGLADFTRRMGSNLPRLELRVSEASRDGEVCRIRARLSNAGALPTGLAVSDRRADAVGAWVALELPPGSKLIAGHERCTLARLAGGGISRECEWIVYAPAGSTFTLRAGGDWALPIGKELKP